MRFTSCARKAKVLKELGVSAEQLSHAPEITPFLKDAGGNPKAVLRALRFSEDPVVKCFLSKHDSLGVWARRNIGWEAIGLGAGLDLAHLLGSALVALREHGMTLKKLTAMSHYPEVMKKRIEQAMLPGGWRDRDALDKLLGFL